MITVKLFPFAYTTPPHERSLVVRYRVEKNDTFFKTGFWTFPTPTHVSDMFERAYLELYADAVYWQHSLTITDDKGWFN